MQDGKQGAGVIDREQLRAQLAACDERRKKIIGGVLAVMFKNPERVREREWISEQFLQVALLAGDWEQDGGGQELGSADQAVGLAQDYARANIDPILNACFALFACVGEDLRERAPDERTQESAMLQALSYF